MTSQTPTISRVLQEAIEGRLVDVFTAMPGEIVSYDVATNTATVQPCLKRKTATEDGEEVETLPVLEDVPVAHPRTAKAFIHLPVQRGDYCQLIFNCRSIEKWKDEGGVLSPDDPRKFDISDAVAWLGGYPTGEAVAADPDLLTIKYGNAKITLAENGETEMKAGSANLSLKPAGTVALGTSSINAIKLLDDFIAEVLKITVPTPVGPSGTPVNAVAMQAIKQKLARLL